MENISIISIADSDTSAAALNETYSPKKRPSMAHLPVTPKREAVDTTLNTTFTPEDKKVPAKVQDETFSPVKEVVQEEAPVSEPVSEKKKPATRTSRTPMKRKLPEVVTATSVDVSSPVAPPPASSDTKAFDSPVPHPAVPDICVVPPSTERRTLRRSVRTPSKLADPVVATRASTRRASVRQTPLKTVPEKKATGRGRKGSKKDKEETEKMDEDEVPETPAKGQVVNETPVETVEHIKSPVKEEEPEKTVPLVKEDDVKNSEVLPEISLPEKSPVKKEESTQEEEDTKTTIPTQLHLKEEQKIETKEEESVPQKKNKSSVPSLSDDPTMLMDVEQPTLIDDEVFEANDSPVESPQEEMRAPMFASPVLLKSIRKRSMSTTDMHPPLPKRNFRVQFHSPGNMEKTITEIDESLYLNFTKSFASSFSIPSTTASATASSAGNQSMTENGVNLVKPLRRKRSLSNAETPVDKMATLQFLMDKDTEQKKKSGSSNSLSTSTSSLTTGGSAVKKMPTPSPRKKMPNFAAIHQNIFQQMESLVDFKERKKERAQLLLSAAPLQDGTRPNIIKPVSRGAIGKIKDLAAIKKPASNLMKPKHRTIGKKPTVPAGVVKMTEKKLAAILQSTDFPMGDDKDEEAASTEDDIKPLDNKLITTTREPVTSTGDVAAVVKKEDTKENNLTASKSSKIKVPRVYNKDTTSIKPRTLNGTASTTGTSMTGLRNRSATVNKTPSKAVPAPVAQFPKVEVEDKPTTGNAYKIVKGVRMNRRFELMMKHRNKTDKK